MHRKLKISGIFLLFCTFFACSRAKEEAKEVVNKTGELVGQTASEFGKGMSQGLDKTFECEVLLTDGLKNKGLGLGKFSINHDSLGHENILTAYLIFEQDFDSKLTVKLTDPTGLEYGRCQQKIKAKAGEARYVDFVFDPRTDIEGKSKFSILEN